MFADICPCINLRDFENGEGYLSKGFMEVQMPKIDRDYLC